MQRKSELKVVFRPIEAVLPYDGNPRIILQNAVDKVAASIRAFGWQQPIVVDANGVIIVGHTRRLAAIHLGMSKVPVIVADLTAESARAYRLADNRVADETRWDMDALATELTALASVEIDLLSLGFDPIELPNIEVLPTEISGDEVLPLDKVSSRCCPHCGGDLP